MLSWKLGRVPEPELMEDPEEVSSYASAAASRHLGAIDDSFIEHLARLLSCAAEDRRPLRALDIGCGPAQIPIKFLKRFTGWHVVAVDRSWSMLGRARQDAQAAGVQDRLQLVAA